MRDERAVTRAGGAGKADRMDWTGKASAAGKFDQLAMVRADE